MMEAVEVLVVVRRTQRLVLDTEGRILEEYDRCITRTLRARLPGAHFVGSWLEGLHKKSLRVEFYSGHVPNRHRRHLLQDLSFDAGDLPFVGSAGSSPDRLIVSEESDFSADVKTYLLREMGIRVLSLAEALQELTTA